MATFAGSTPAEKDSEGESVLITHIETCYPSTSRSVCRNPFMKNRANFADRLFFDIHKDLCPLIWRD